MTRGTFDRAAQAPAKFKPGDRVRTRNIHPPTHTRLPRYVRGQSAWSSATTAATCFRIRPRPSRRESAMALHRGVRRPRIVGPGRRPDAEDLDRRVRALSGAGVMRRRGRGSAPRSAVPEHSAAMPKARCSASPGRRRPSRWRWRCTSAALFTWPEWAATLGDEIKRAQAAGDPDTGETYYRHWLARWSASSPRRASPTSDTLRAIATPGTTPPTARRTAQPIELRPDDFG